MIDSQMRLKKNGKRQMKEMPQSYEQLKDHVLRMLRKKIDNENYLMNIKLCMDSARNALSDKDIGETYLNLLKTIAKLKMQQQGARFKY